MKKNEENVETTDELSKHLRESTFSLWKKLCVDLTKIDFLDEPERYKALSLKIKKVYGIWKTVVDISVKLDSMDLEKEA